MSRTSFGRSRHYDGEIKDIGDSRVCDDGVVELHGTQVADQMEEANLVVNNKESLIDC